jgi:hypothetical protein
MDALKSAEKGAVPRSKPSKSKMKPKPQQAVAIHKEVKSLFHTWKVEGKQKDSQIHTEIKRLKRQSRTVQRQNAAIKQRSIYEEIQSAHVNDQQLFHKLVARQRKQASTSTETLIYKDKTYSGSSEVQAGFTSYFSDLATPSHDDVNKDLTDIVTGDLAYLDAMSVLLPNEANSFTFDEVAIACRCLNRNKASDCFGVTAEHLRFALTPLTPLLTSVFNGLLQTRLIPHSFKQGILLPLVKKANKSKKMPSNYRGITIISAIGKHFELALLLRITHIFREAQSGMQRGFTERVSPLFAAFILCEAINEMEDNRTSSTTILLDAEKAFDKVWHEKLFRKLALMGLPVECWKVLRDWYRGFSTSVKWGNIISDPFDVLQGTIQGSGISPHTFKVYNNDLLKTIEAHGLGAKIGTEHCSTPTCADDIAVITPTHTGDAQKILHLVEIHTRNDRMSINNSKTKVIIRHNRDKNKDLAPTLSLDNGELAENMSAVHLGMLHTPGRDVNKLRVLDRLSVAMGALYALFGAGLHGRNGLNPSANTKLWKTYIMPRLLHGMEIPGLNDAQVKKLETFQMDKLKHIMGLPDRTSNAAVLGLASVLPVQAELDRKVLTFFRNMIADSSSVEYKILLRQLAVKTNDSSSWAIYLENILEKYSLPKAHTVMECPPAKTAWKNTIRKAIDSHWISKLEKETNEQNSCRFLSSETLSPLKQPLLWTNANCSLRESHKAQTKAWLMCGVYRLQVHESMFTRRNGKRESPICKLCDTGPEDRMHFLLKCPALEKSRTELATLRETLHSHNHQEILTNETKLLHCLIDCSHKDLNLSQQLQDTVETIARDLLYQLHVHRCRILGVPNKSPAVTRGRRPTPRSASTSADGALTTRGKIHTK